MTRATTPVRRRRLESGLTQAELAARAGVSRQLVAAVEAGRHVPAVNAALGLARALGCSVEQLFAAPVEPIVPALGRKWRERAPLRLGRVGDRLVADELADHGVAGAAWSTPDAVSQGGTVRVFEGAAPAGVVVAGCDPAFGIAERMLAGQGERSLLAVSAPTGRALEALRRERVHAAVVHGRDRTLPAPPVPVKRWHVARWQVGVGVARKHRVHSLEALIGARLPVAQRESAAASQQAFERALAGLGRSAPPPGALASGHLDAARTASIVEGAAVTTEAAAGAFGLEFLPLEDHVVELWTAETWTGQAGVTALLELLCSRAFTERVVHFGGYDLDGCGEPAGVT